MDYRDNRQRWAESHQVVHFYAGQWCTFTPALTLDQIDVQETHEKRADYVCYQGAVGKSMSEKGLSALLDPVTKQGAKRAASRD